MCGICGFVGPPRPEQLAAMLARLEHRGPDDEGTFVSSRASIGARRLAIIDVKGGRQPALSEDERIAAVLNGEIYNHRQLRAMLERRGHHFRSRSDTEVLPHLYEEYGERMVDLLRGMFAVAIWDERRQRLVLARDRAGEKPLFHADAGGGPVFASELKSLVSHPEVGREIDPHALRLYLSLQYVPGPETILAGVRKLPPGHLLVWEGGTERLQRYWDVAGSTPAHGRSFEGTARELGGLLADAVASQIHADVPVGALLSGGIDSAGVVALMSRAAPEPPRTFTVGFGEAAFDERPHARAVAEALGTRHTELEVGPPSAAELERLAWHLDEPVGDQAALPTYLISKVAAEHVKVVLTGEGGDELFGGYPRYRWFARAGRLNRLPPGLARALGRLGRLVAPGERASRGIDLLLTPRGELERHLAWVGVFAGAEIDELLAPDWRGAAELEAIARLEKIAESWPQAASVERIMHLDLRTWLVDDILTKADRMSMAASVEARAPFLDHRLIEFATSLPPAVRLHGNGTKALFREALRGTVPEPALARRKQAFRVPVEAWLQERLAELVRELLLSADAATGPLLRREAVKSMLAERGSAASRRVWTLAVLELWMRQLASPAPSRPENVVAA